MAAALLLRYHCCIAVATPLLHHGIITVAPPLHRCCPASKQGPPRAADSPLAARDGSTQWSNDTGSTSERAPTNKICRRAPLAADLVRGHFIAQLERNRITDDDSDEL